MYSDTILKKWTGPPDIEEDHQILGAGGPLGQCSRKLISNPVTLMERMSSPIPGKLHDCPLQYPDKLDNFRNGGTILVENLTV